MIRNGRPDVTKEFHVGGKGSFGGRRAGTGVPIKTPAIDLAEVGAGGGSIAWVDKAGTLHVGPRSAGSEPGPACYDRGGTEPTVTDCNLVLGYLDPASIRRRHPGRCAATSPRRRSERVLADALGVEPRGSRAGCARHRQRDHGVGCARGHGSARHRPAGLRGRRVSAERGPCTPLASPSGSTSTPSSCPPSCGVGSAVGLLVTDLSTDRVASRLVPQADADAETLESVYMTLAEAGAQDLGVTLENPDVGVTPDERCPVLPARLTSSRSRAVLRLTKADIDDAVEKFYDEYRRAYGIAMRGAVEFVSHRVRVTQVIPKVSVSKKPAGRGRRCQQCCRPASRLVHRTRRIRRTSTSTTADCFWWAPRQRAHASSRMPSPRSWSHRRGGRWSMTSCNVCSDQAQQLRGTACRTR